MPVSPDQISIADVAGQLQALGIQEGDVLLVHTSFRAARPVEGGPAGLIEALGLAVGPSGTLVMPSWTGDDESSFDPASTPASTDLGIVADTFWRLPAVRRGRHPFAFAARGPMADRITADPLILPPHQSDSPVGRVLDRDGRILLLGVHHDANTSLHLAELMAGVPYRIPHHITVLEDGGPKRIEYLENDHCCALFRLADDWLRQRGVQSEGIVGHAPSRLMRSRDLIETVLPRLDHDPWVFVHPNDSGCEECVQARSSMPNLARPGRADRLP